MDPQKFACIYVDSLNGIFWMGGVELHDLLSGRTVYTPQMIADQFTLAYIRMRLERVIIWTYQLQIGSME